MAKGRPPSDGRGLAILAVVLLAFPAVAGMLGTLGLLGDVEWLSYAAGLAWFPGILLAVIALFAGLLSWQRYRESPTPETRGLLAFTLVLLTLAFLPAVVALLRSLG